MDAEFPRRGTEKEPEVTDEGGVDSGSRATRGNIGRKADHRTSKVQIAGPRTSASRMKGKVPK